MDLKAFYQKLRQVEAGLTEKDVVVISRETPEGGKADVPIEVRREVAARLIVEGRARIATAEETTAFEEHQLEEKKAAEQHAAANRVQLTVISDADLRALKGNGKKS